MTFFSFDGFLLVDRHDGPLDLAFAILVPNIAVGAVIGMLGFPAVLLLVR